MADNLTVRADGAPVSGSGTDGSAKKSKLEQQVEALGEKIKHRTGRAMDDEVLRAMVMRKQAKAERADQAEKSKQDYLKNTSHESVQARQAEDKGAIIGRAREMHTADGLTRHQRQLVSSDPNAPTILPPATHPPITAEGAAAVLEKVFAFLKPANAEAPALNVESYSETLVPRPPTQPPEKNARDGGQQQQPQPTDRPVTGGPATEPPTAEQPTHPTSEQPTPGRPQQPTAEKPTTGRPQQPTAEKPTTGRPQQPTAEKPTTERPQQPTSEKPTIERPQQPTAEKPTTERPQQPTAEKPTTERPQQPTAEKPATGRPQQPTGEQPATGRPQGQPTPEQPATGRPQGQPAEPRPQTPVHGHHLPEKPNTNYPARQPMVASHSGKTPLGQTIAYKTRGLQTGGNTPRGAMRANAEAPTDRPVTGDPVAEQPTEQPGTTQTRPQGPQTSERPERPATGGAERPVTGEEPDPHYPPRPPQQTPVKLPGQRQPATGKGPHTHSDRTPLGQTTLSGAQATDGSRATPLGQTIGTAQGQGTPAAGSPPTSTPSGPAAGSQPGGPRPGAGGAVGGGPTAGRPTTVRAARPLPSEGSGSGAVMSLRGGGAGRRTRATDVTTGDPPFVNNGGGFDTTTSWDGMHFNWEAFFTLFLFKYQEDENEARRMMKELREAMHKLAQEGIKAKIALEKMNQAFERAEKAFELGNALKGVMDSAAQAAQPQQNADGTQQPRNGQQQQPGAGQQTGAQPGTTNPAADVAAGQTTPNDPGAGASTPGGANPQGPQPQQTTPDGQTPSTPTGDQRQPATANGTRNGPNRGNRSGRNGNQQGDEQQGPKMPGAGLVGNVSEHLRAAMERLNAELISSAQRGGSEVDARIRSNYMQAQGLLNQMVQILAMSRSK